MNAGWGSLRSMSAVGEVLHVAIDSQASSFGFAYRIRRFVVGLIICLFGASVSLIADDSSPLASSEPLEKEAFETETFEKEIQPLLVRLCGKCHGKMPKDNDLNLTSLNTIELLFMGLDSRR